MNMDVQVVGTRDATIAGIVTNICGKQYAASGTAKREPHDEDNAEVATLLAIGRALDNLSNKVLKQANGLVKHNDDMKSYKNVQKAKPVKKKPVAKVLLKK